MAEDEVHFRSSKELGDPLVDSDPFLVTGDVLVRADIFVLEQPLTHTRIDQSLSDNGCLGYP